MTGKPPSIPQSRVSVWQQIQSWPTPEIFTRRRGGVAPEQLTTGLALLSCVVLLPVNRNAGTDQATAGIGLVSITIPGPINRAVTDQAAAGLTMLSCVIPTPVSNSPTDNAAGAVALVSCLVPSAAGLRTLNDDTNAGLRLVSISI